MINFKEFLEEIPVIEQLSNFISSGQHNLWLRDEFMQVYVRHGRHYIEGKILNTLDVANIQVESRYQNQGIATKFFEEAHKMNPWEATFVENTLNPQLERRLERQGWIKIDVFPACFYRLKHISEGSKTDLPGVNALGQEMQTSCKLVFGKKAFNQTENNCYNVVQNIALRFGYKTPSHKELTDLILNFKGNRLHKNPQPNLGRSAAFLIVREHEETYNDYHVSFEINGKEYNYGPGEGEYVLLIKIPLQKVNIEV